MQEFIFGPNGPKLKLVSPDGNTVKELQLNDDGSLSIESTQVKVGGTNELSVSFTDTSKPYRKAEGNNYETLSYFLFGGTAVMGTPSEIEVLAWSGKPNKTYDIRVIRQDTGQVISEKMGASNEEIAAVSLGAMAGLPSTPTVWEIQGRCQNGGQCRLAFMRVIF